MIRRLFAILAAMCLLMQHPAHAVPAQLRIIPQTELRFGTFAVLDQGYRIVGPAGNVQSVGVFSTTSGDTGPARFTISYDRGSNSRRELNLRIQLVLAAAPVVTQGGITARLTSYQTDLPGYASLAAGQVIEINIPNCRQRICERTFHVGGRLDVDRNFGGGSVGLAIPADAVLISVR